LKILNPPAWHPVGQVENYKLKNPSTPSYWSLVWQRFQKNRGAKWSFRAFVILLWVAALNPFIAGDVPIYTKIKGESNFPIVRQYLIDLGIAQPTIEYLNPDSWHEQKYDKAIFPIIPYSANYRDRDNVHYTSPFGPQKMKKNQAWHWLGTDSLGKDVAAGIIGGIRVALKVGLLSMLIAIIIGLFMGGLAGYFGDDGLRLPLLTILINGIALFLAIHFGFICRSYQLSLKEADGELFKSILIFLGILLLFNGLAKLLQYLPILQKMVTVPLDMVIMRIIEVINSVPGLLLIIAFSAIFSTATLWPIILIIGFFNWTGIARFFRAELLKVRRMEYIQASKALGFSNWRILFKHALPNAIGPVIILVAFGIAGAILAEASLSFLGIGITSDVQVTWGTMLRDRTISAWWMSIFPGLAIFVTILIFNLIGEGLKDAIDAKDL